MATETRFIKNLKAARRAGAPLLVVETADPASTIKQVRANAKNSPLISWNVSTGFQAENQEGDEVLERVCGEGDATAIVEFEPAMRKALEFDGRKPASDGKPAKGGVILFIHNGHRFVEMMHPDVIKNIQAIWNLRDSFKRDMRTCIFLTPGIQLPAELKEDFVILDEPLPNNEEIASIANTLYKDAKVTDKIDAPTKERAIEAMKGLSAFAIEQVVAMSLSPEGIDLDSLWERKRKAIEQTPGLKIWRGTQTYDHVRGVENMKDIMTQIMNGEDAPTVIVFMDELEKQIAGATGGDLSGVSQEMHGQLLSWMSDEDILGLLMVGHPGCSKSHICKTTGAHFVRPVVVLNVSEMKGGIVGQSTTQMKYGLKKISAIGRPIVMATCNKLDALSPELRSRFELGTYFFDLPNKDEREAVWDLYIHDRKLKDAKVDFDEDGWTPREIRACCFSAWRLRTSLEKASRNIVPVKRSSPERIEALRREASGKFLSSSYPGVYEYTPAKPVKEFDSNRRVNFDA